MDSDFLKKLIDTEQRAKMLVEEALNRGDVKVREAQTALNARLMEEREKKLDELDQDYGVFAKEIQKKRDLELLEYEATLKNEEVFPDEAFRAIREVLAKL